MWFNMWHFNILKIRFCFLWTNLAPFSISLLSWTNSLLANIPGGGNCLNSLSLEIHRSNYSFNNIRLIIRRRWKESIKHQVSSLHRYHFPDMEMHSPDLKPRRGVGRKGVPGHTGGLHKGSLAGKEDENQAWLDMLEKATNSVRYISRHIRKEHFIREVTDDCFSHQPVWLLIKVLFVKLFLLWLMRSGLTQNLTCAPLFSASMSVCLSVCTSLSHPGRPRLEVCGAGVGQDFPVGLSHSVNTGNCPHLHSCSADVPQHTLTNRTNWTYPFQELTLFYHWFINKVIWSKKNK